MFALLAYAFITLFTGVALYGHVVLFRDIFSGRSSGKAGAQTNSGLSRDAESGLTAAFARDGAPS